MTSPRVEQANDQNLKKLGELIQNVQFAMLTTVQSDGSLYSRPMATPKTEFDGTLWFFTGSSTHKADEVQKNPRVNVAFSKPDTHTYITITGRAELVHDLAKAKELWDPLYQAWFPKGLDDPELRLLKVNVDSAEYWESPQSPATRLLGLSRAALPGVGKKISNIG